MTTLWAFRWMYPLMTAVLLVAACAAVALGQPAPMARAGEGTSAPSDRLLLLEPAIAPPAGTEAIFVITEKSVRRITERSGIFLLAPDETVRSAEEDVHLAIRARYTMLSPDPRTGHPRVAVEAVPIDAATGSPLRQDAWRGVYRLEDGEAEWLEGSPVPDPYEDLVEPGWLAEWAISPSEQLPRHPIAPGDAWHAAPDLELEDFPFGDLELDVPLTGRFVGWVDVPEAGRRAAHIMETMRGTSTERQEVFDDILSDVFFEADLTSQFWMIPGDFPHEGRQELHGTMLMVLGEETGAPPGVGGKLEFTYAYERSIQREADRGLSSTEVQRGEEPADRVIRPGQRVSGFLGPWSADFGDGSYADYYEFHGTEGDEIRIVLRSDDFDAYLFLLDDREEGLADDDDSAGGTDARIRYTLPYTGTYWIVVNTLFPGQTGAYTLSVEYADPNADIDRALKLIERLRFPYTLSEDELLEAETVLYELLELTNRYRRDRSAHTNTN